MRKKIKLDSFILGYLILLICILMMTLIIKPAKASQGNEGTFCDSGKTYYCWISFPYWQCLSTIGGLRCADPIQK
ncbi:MAG: hypothetical protein H5U06_10530 [Candidatus Aminicenantes bacterium]|nr:hypothetical protein [Candidatus Aminicenantes bacterium]